MESKRASNLEPYRQALIKKRSALVATAGILAEDALQKSTPAGVGNSSTVPNHPADLGTEESDQTRRLTLVEREEGEVAEIDDALNRIEVGSYGICENCEEPIGERRLQALPEARYCVTCEADLEQESRRQEALTAH